MKAMQQNETKREAHLRELASRLLFSRWKMRAAASVYIEMPTSRVRFGMTD
jgi:hypothetical protein